MTSQIKTLRLVFGDQLNAEHSWFKKRDEHITYLIMELRQETDYTKHHIQKLCAFFLSMQNFAEALKVAGHNVIHLTLDETAEFKGLGEIVRALTTKVNAKVFEYQRPDEHRLVKLMESLELDQVDIKVAESEHFVLEFHELSQYFSPNKSHRMESFYRKMRTRFNIMMSDGEPWGGQWNFDALNRNKLKQSDLSEIPAPRVFENDVSEVKERIDRHGVDYIGRIKGAIVWPTSRAQAVLLLEHFCVHCLPSFGMFQDAMTHKSSHAWSLYHSRLSFALNAKLIAPMRVINRAIEEYRARTPEISLAQIEGFVRQILGWREFMRGVYWVNMPSYSMLNTLGAKRDLPEFFWTGNTKMNCMKRSIDQSLEYAYAHHIQRLMITGNFCLLTGIAPDQVDAWYLGIYIDAIEWVEMPNTRGMSQFADGGIIASKPYSASGAYISRMSDYCNGCHYKVKEKVGDKACPFNSLYWHFMHTHRDLLEKNPRIGMIYRNFDRMEENLRSRVLENGRSLLTKLDTL